MPYFILGVDPGNTAALCALSFDGSVLECDSCENGGLLWAVSKVEGWGTPSLVACDVNPAPEFVLKLASYFNSPLYVPQGSVREEQKREILRQMEQKDLSSDSKIAKNTHERDALSAAVIGWRANQNQLRSVLSLQYEHEQKQRLCHLVLSGIRLDVAKQMLNSKQNKSTQEQIDSSSVNSFDSAHSNLDSQNIQSIKHAQKVIDKLREQLLSYERANSELRKRVQFLEQNQQNLMHQLSLSKKNALKEISKDREVMILRSKLQRANLRVSEHGKNLHRLLQELKRVKSKAKTATSTKNQVQSRNVSPQYSNTERGIYPKQENLDNVKPTQLSQTDQTIGIHQTSQHDRFQSTQNSVSKRLSKEHLKNLDSLDNLQRMVEQYRRRYAQEDDTK